MMNKLSKLVYKKSDNQGFTTLEVLVSIVIALAFVSVAMQSLVLSMGMKIQAQAKQRANQLIQEDLERVATLASNVPATTAPQTITEKCNAFASGGAVSAYANGYAKDLWDNVQPAGSTAPSVKLLRKADGTEVGKTLTLARTNISNASSTAPHRTLKINYQVTDPDGNLIAQRYVEVIPDVALRCP